MLDNMKGMLVSEVSTLQSLLKERTSNLKKQRDHKKMFGRTDTATFNNRIIRKRSTQSNKTLFASHPDDFGSSKNDQFQDVELSLQNSEAVLKQNDTDYLKSRVEAVTSIEQHISELGGIFSRFSELIAQSESTISRIDDNVALAEERMFLGRDELLKYWNGQKGNFWLFAKISFVVLFFLTIFIVFIL